VDDRFEVERAVSIFNQRDQDLSATGSTNPVRFSTGLVCASIGGTGSISAYVERCTRDPTSDANWHLADEEAVSSTDLATAGISISFEEPSRAWWRVRVTARTGTAKINLTGPAA
jgi:hypothetical protein